MTGNSLEDRIVELEMQSEHIAKHSGEVYADTIGWLLANQILITILISSLLDSSNNRQSKQQEIEDRALTTISQTTFSGLSEESLVAYRQKAEQKIDEVFASLPRKNDSQQRF